MSKARDLANAGTALTTVSATELGYVDGVTSAIQTQIDTKAPSTTPTLTSPIVISPEERTTVSATAATGTVNFDALTQGVLYYTTDASANWTLNVRGSSDATLDSILTTGDAITVSFLVTNGATEYYQTAFNIDGSAVTSLTSANLTGALPSIDGSALTGVGSTTFGDVGTYVTAMRNFPINTSYAGGTTVAGSNLLKWQDTGQGNSGFPLKSDSTNVNDTAASGRP